MPICPSAVYFFWNRGERVKAEGGEEAKKGAGSLADGSGNRGASAKKEKANSGRDGVGDEYGVKGGWLETPEIGARKRKVRV